MPTTIRTRAELFLARQGGRPRKVDRELCRRLRGEGVSAAEIAVRIGCDQSTVFRALKNKEGVEQCCVYRGSKIRKSPSKARV